jgi:hypothetical protein
MWAILVIILKSPEFTTIQWAKIRPTWSPWYIVPESIFVCIQLRVYQLSIRNCRLLTGGSNPASSQVVEVLPLYRAKYKR